MRGTILLFKADRARALILGENGQRYRFTGDEWRGPSLPVIGEPVEFVAEGTFAREVAPTVLLRGR